MVKIRVNPYSKEELAKQILIRQKAEQDHLPKREHDRYQVELRREAFQKRQQEAERRQLAAEATAAAQKHWVFNIEQPIPWKCPNFTWEGGIDLLLGNLGGAEIDLGNNNNEDGTSKKDNNKDKEKGTNKEDGNNNENKNPVLTRDI